jgi:hypothetical protein
LSNGSAPRIVFVSLARSAAGVAHLQLLLKSIRSFGGHLARSPVLLFEVEAGAADAWKSGAEGVHVLPLIVPEHLEHYPLAAKVYACVRGETLAREQNVQSLVWIDPACLVVNPPLLFHLGLGFDAAVRPVHIKNIGLGATESIDAYWQKVYEAVGVHDLSATVESFVDAERLRAYFNTHAFAVNPGKGLLREWYECFASLVSDEGFQVGACSDERHRVFLHQAVLSALLASALDSERVRMLPVEYNYPYNLHQSVPDGRRARALNDLITVAYEDRPLDPSVVNDIEIREPLRAWLAERAGGADGGQDVS